MLPTIFAHRLLPSFAILVWLAWPGFLHAVSPEITGIEPPGGQRGKNLKLNVKGYNLKDAVDLIFYTPTIKLKQLKIIDDSELQVTLEIPTNCQLGEHGFRVRTRTGVTELRTFSVGPFPSASEQEPNNDQAKALNVKPNTTVMGVVTEADIDMYCVHLKKGQRLAVEVEGMRLGGILFDPKIAVSDEKGQQMASCDDSALHRQDPFLTLKAPATGNYYVAIQETVNRGNYKCQYRMHIGTFPRPTAIYPLGGPASGKLSVQWIGDSQGPKTQITTSQRIKRDGGFFPKEGERTAPSSHPFRLVKFQNVFESEPNNDAKKATPSQLAIPFAFNGILQQAKDVDWFRFEAKKGEKLNIEVFASRLGTRVDSVLGLYDANKNLLRRSDDGDSRDSRIIFTPTKSGSYYLHITDLRREGGPDYVYRIELTKFRPKFTLFLPRRTRKSQEGQTIIIPRGSRIAAPLGVQRLGFQGDILPMLEGPKGVLNTPTLIPKDRYLGLVLFEAEAKAPLSHSLINVKAIAVDKKLSSQDIQGEFQQTIDLVAGTADSLYHSFPTNKMAVSVVEEAPFSIALDIPKTPLVQDGTINLTVSATRHKGFESDIEVSLPFLPEWVYAPKQVTIPADKTTATIPLTATAEAEVRDWEILATAQAEVGEGYMSVSSKFVQLSIVPPTIIGKLKDGRGEPGKTATVVLELKTPLSPLTKPVAKLLGLPKGVKAKPITITKETKKLEFVVQLDGALSDGEYQGLYCGITYQTQGQPVVAYLGRGTTLKVGRGAAVSGTGDGKKLSPLDRLRKKK